MDLGFSLKGLTFSPITGGEGNIEFLAHLGLLHNDSTVVGEDIRITGNFVEIQKLARHVVEEASNTFHSNPSK
ncbi:hypothetical protein D3C78_1917620 [compost metagenome]